MLKRNIVIVFMICWALVTKAQCNDQLLDIASEKLAGFVYVNNFKVKLQEVKKKKDPRNVTYTVILNKGVKYRFVVVSAEEYESKMIFDLMGYKGKLASSYNAATGKHYPVIEFLCQRTGVHYLYLGFQEKEGCGALVYAFKEKKASLSQYNGR